jgi:hypothetical protein
LPPREDIDWSVLNVDYNGTRFYEFEICVEGHRVRTVGFLPYPDELYRYTLGGYEPYTLAVFGTGSRKGGSLYILVREKRARVLFLVDTIPGPEAAILSPQQIYNAFGDLFTEADSHTVYVEPKLYDDARSRIQLPGWYRALRGWYYQSRDLDAAPTWE